MRKFMHDISISKQRKWREKRGSTNKVPIIITNKMKEQTENLD